MADHAADPTRQSEHEAEVEERQDERGNVASADARVDESTAPSDEQLLGEEPVHRDGGDNARPPLLDERVDPAERGGSDTEHHR